MSGDTIEGSYVSHYVILGAGVAGLSAAYHAQARGLNVKLYEAEPAPGGLLNHFAVGEWLFDNAAHFFFGSEPEVLAIFDQTPAIEHEAVPYNWDNGYWLPHPVQNHMFGLPVADKTALIVDFISRPEIEIKNYRDWLYCEYGVEIAERWPIMYTKKYWIDSETLGIDWIKNRMKKSEISEIILGAMTPSPPRTYYLRHLRYPLRGGYRAFLEPLIRNVEVQTQYRATSVNWRDRYVQFSNNQRINYNFLLSTIPLPEILNIMTDVPTEIKEIASTLFATRIDLISMGFNKIIKGRSGKKLSRMSRL
jgi:protoporphyrinogen oxidase